ncbi:MAG: hypothetical protein AB1403_25640, partial [Candidatus Riflebacteria bacterium]
MKTLRLALIVLLPLLLGTNSCFQQGKSPTNPSITPDRILLSYTAPITPTSTTKPYPTMRRDPTPTFGLTPDVWPEFSSEFTYNEKYGL